MKSPFVLAGAVALALTVPSAFAAEINLVGVTFPEGKKISIPFTRTAIAPKAATLTGTMRMEKGQVDVRLAWERMEPAVLFAGNITAYSVWAVTRDGRPENLGELQVRNKKSGEGSFRTGKVNFAVLVSAEVLPGGVLPSDLILFTSGKVDPAKAKNWEFSIETSSVLSEFTRPDNPSIANLTYTAKGAEPIELQQARKAYDIRAGAELGQRGVRSTTPARPRVSRCRRYSTSVSRPRRRGFGPRKSGSVRSSRPRRPGQTRPRRTRRAWRSRSIA